MKQIDHPVLAALLSRCAAVACAGQTRTWVRDRLLRFRKGHPQEPLAAQRRACSPWRRDSRSCTIPPPPISGRWRAIPRAISTPAAAPAPSCIASRPSGEKKTLAEFEAWRSTPSPSTARIRSTSPPRRTARSTASPPPARAEVFYDPKAKVHLGAGVRQQGRSVRRHRRPGRDPSRHAGRQGQRVLQDRGDACALAGGRRARQPDRRHRARTAW